MAASDYCITNKHTDKQLSVNSLSSVSQNPFSIMANSSGENSPNSSPNHSDQAVPMPTPAAPAPAPAPVPARVRTLHVGEGSSSVPIVAGQELFEGFSSSSSSSSSPSPATTPPRRVVQISLGGTRRESGETNMKKTLALAAKQDEDNAATQLGSEAKRRKGEMDAPKSEPICSLCGKRFASWKGVFGHLRAHPERDWRGAFPPPKGVAGKWSPIKMSGPDDHQALQVQLLAPKMLDLARETLAKMREDSINAADAVAGGAAGADGGAASSRRVTNIDLNREPGSSSSPSPPPQGGTGGSGSRQLDLNKSPPESDDGNNGRE